MAKILVVDDNATNRRIITVTLERNGHTATEAADGIEGLQLARESAPDLIIIDLYMPRLNGVDFVKALRADSGIKETKVVLYTGATIDAATRIFMELSRISHVISKPSQPVDILRIVNEALASE